MSRLAILEVTARLAAVVRRHVGNAEMGNAQREARPLLEEALRAAGIEPDGPRLTVWRQLKEGLVDYSPGVFIPRPIKEAHGVSLLALPTGQAAHLRLTGSYASLPSAWEHLFAECKDRQLAGSSWEVYTNPDEDSGAAETDLYALLA